MSDLFPPIAIVGQGCVLPGTLTSEGLWSLVEGGRSAISRVPEELWRLAPSADRKALAREIASDVGGYVSGFDEVFDAGGFLIAPERLAGLDPVFLFTLHAAREALRSAGMEIGVPHERGMVVLGNLGYPTPGLVDFALEVWGEGPRTVDARNRFQSGLPAQLVARALGFRGGAFAVDAACTSSLYAIKLACDGLHDGRVDIALAGGVNHADDLFLHLGFTALGALSPTGQSRPFHRRADGLVPAQGAAVVVLKRLDDAAAAGDPILGVIRGVGLSNDGRSRGLLVPSEEGQVRAMRTAYAQSGLVPSDISLVECHATGTAVGDATELRSLRTVFEGASDVPVGSLKSNLGHLITASGAAALIKVLCAIRAQVRPPTLHAEEPLDELAAPLRVLMAAEPWPSDGPRRAAISNFGFGGNNAHLLVEEWVPSAPRGLTGPARGPREWVDVEIAVVAQTVTAGGAASTAAFEAAFLEGQSTVAGDPPQSIAEPFEMDLGLLRFPPADLKDALSQQTLLLHAAQTLDDVIGRLPHDRTALLVGMQCDAEVARCSLPWRRPRAAPSSEAPLTAAIVIGCMPNMVANRLGHQLDLRAPSFTVSAEEASGTVALELAMRSLRAGEIDAALVGAVDLSCEPVARAAGALLPSGEGSVAGDAAVLLVLKRLADARRTGDPVLAVLTAPAADAEVTLRVGSSPNPEIATNLSPLFGHAHAASGLLHVAASISACRRRALPGRTGRPQVPWLPRHAERRARVDVAALGGITTSTFLRADDHSLPTAAEMGPRLAVFSASDVDGLIRALTRRESSDGGAVRLAVVGTGAAELAARLDLAATLLPPLRASASGSGRILADGIFFGEGPQAGELAFVFTGPAGAYLHMGRDLALALPELVDRLAARSGALREAAGWIYDHVAPYTSTPTEKLWASSYLCQLHAELTRELLGLRPSAAIGYCSGESNALFALGAWDDLDGFRRAIDDVGVYSRELCGELHALRRAWAVPEGIPVGWTTMRVRAPVDEVLALIADEPQVHLTIISGPRDLVIAGDPDACARVAKRIGVAKTTGLGYDFVVHCPEARAFAEEWRALHHRPTAPVPGVRFYTHATNDSYAATSDAAADALLGQAMNPIDFPSLIERAYDDGVRLFLEHGPHAGCTKWIDEVLSERDHLAVALDRYGRSSLLQSVESVARMYAAGVPMNHRALTTRLEPTAAPSPPGRRRLPMQFQTHFAPVRLPAPDPIAAGAVEVMVPAPKLPPPCRRMPVPVVALDRDKASGAAPLVEVLAAHHEKLVALHQAFLRQQTDVHTRFLRLLLSAGSPGSTMALATGADPVAPPSPTHTAPPPESRELDGVPAPSPEAPVATRMRPPTGPRFDRRQLETLASGKISSVFGPLFERQDAFVRQVRMPEPPLLLADRVLGIEGTPGEMGRGVIWTQTDVTDGAWYLHEGRMPAGILVESGQADLLLISWLGVDFLNQGERIYRLLGCDLQSHGELPQPGDTLTYEIHVDGHARQGDVRLFFFHYDCWVNGDLRVTVRNGQAGFFTDGELAASAGILWDPEAAQPTEPARLDAPAVACARDHFTAGQISAFIEGRARECFGPGFERADTHTRTPAIQGGYMRLLDEVSDFDPDGGPWGRGYLRARLALSPDSWFFPGHFKDDPCMPGTLMFEGCLQAMAIYLTALGYTLDRDGWRFEPVQDHTFALRCRGQALPTNAEVVYEVFVDEIVASPTPTLYADLLGTVDGLTAFHCRRMGLRLVPAWPLDAGRLPTPLANVSSARASARVDGFDFDYHALLASALGRPSEAFGELYRPFDGTRRVARLPGPPYHFMSRVSRVGGPIGGMKVGSVAEVEYDVPPDAWYFAENGARVMPFAVLLEVALQPCGWLASYIGSARTSDVDLVFRNLDGDGTVRREVLPDVGRLVTTTRLDSLSTAGGLIITGFDVAVRAGEECVYELKSACGFFKAEAMREQVGLATSADERRRFGEAGVAVDLASRPERYFGGAPRLPGDRLLMIDRVTGLWPAGGAAGLGRVRCGKDVDASDWFFKAHFFQDPVQPGSLGLEAMIQALQLLMIERGMGAGVASPRFEPIATGTRMTWKYRGQVVPENRIVSVDVALTAVGRGERGPFAVAEGSLWVDGKRIYHARDLGMRIVAGE